ncbi:serine hydrolase domain-containing protein [Streptomyces sp. NPDC087440]|uniref:serine hydrolase domain-containing protein n=1 Tax=Streptomyces sp. NPDC087440 TaxID=3365790 RepID=UPI00382774BA
MPDPSTTRTTRTTATPGRRYRTAAPHTPRPTPAKESVTMSHPTAAPAQDRPALHKALETMVESGFTGVQLRVRDEHGTWSAVAGLAELGGNEPPPLDSPVRVGSNTKTFAATVLLQLVGEGSVGLDTPAADYLPEFGLDPRITVRMLLQHTSGIFNHTGEIYDDGSKVYGIPWSGREWVENRFQAYPPEELVRYSLERPVRFEPGADWSYANTNYVLVRLIIEKVTGRTFAEETGRRILEPLGLADTRVPSADHPQTDLEGPHGHAYYRYEDAEGQEQVVDVTRQDPSWVSTGGDMISTTRDLQTFITALVRGDLLPAPLLAEMYQTHDKVPYGLGVFVQPTGDGGTVITHNGGISGHGALMYATPDGSRTLTAAFNYVDDPDLSLATAFQQATAMLVAEVFGGGDAGPTE